MRSSQHEVSWSLLLFLTLLSSLASQPLNSSFVCKFKHKKVSKCFLKVLIVTQYHTSVFIWQFVDICCTWMLKSELKVRWIFDWIETHWHIYHIYNMSDCVWACSAAPYWPKQTWLNFQTWPQKHDFWNINKENMNLSHSNTAAVSEVAQCYCTYTQKSYQASLIQPYLALPVHCGTSPVCSCHPCVRVIR